VVVAIIRAVRPVDDESVPAVGSQLKEHIVQIYETIYQKANDNETDLEVREQGKHQSVGMECHNFDSRR
jgi:hypothetical protein